VSQATGCAHDVGSGENAHPLLWALLDVCDEYGIDLLAELPRYPDAAAWRRDRVSDDRARSGGAPSGGPTR
jgi:hypothetical protein